jgi:hypothetical protein
MTTEATTGVRDAIVREARRIEEDALYSARGQFEAANAWSRWHFYVGIPMTIVAAAASVSAIADQAVLSAVLALLVAISSGLFTFLNPQERSSRHLLAGNSYKELHNGVRIFREIDCPGSTELDALKTKVHEFDACRNKLNKESPQIPRWAFIKARKGIEQGEATYAADQTGQK